MSKPKRKAHPKPKDKPGVPPNPLPITEPPKPPDNIA